MALSIFYSGPQHINSLEYLKKMHDVELLEIILRLSLPKNKVKKVTKILMNEFGSIDNIIQADENKLNLLKGISKDVFLNIAILKELFTRSLFNKVINKNVISEFNQLSNYLRFNMGYLTTEQLRILFLNTKNVLIADELMSIGTINHLHVYPREIMKRILFHNAKSIILVHNHPSGNSNPSDSDILLTQSIVKMCRIIDVSVYDHIIISKDECYSFKNQILGAII